MKKIFKFWFCFYCG